MDQIVSYSNMSHPLNKIVIIGSLVSVILVLGVLSVNKQFDLGGKGTVTNLGTLQLTTLGELQEFVDILNLEIQNMGGTLIVGLSDPGGTIWEKRLNKLENTNMTKELKLENGKEFKSKKEYKDKKKELFDKALGK